MYSEKVVFITGASGGIGKELVRGYARRGAKVIATDINSYDFNDENVDFYKMDLRKKDEIESVFTKVKEKYGKLNILINNAAIANFAESIFELSVENFDEVMAVNVRGHFICAKQFLELNKKESYGRIVNIASIRAIQAEIGGEAYGASKGAIISLTRSMAVSLIDTNITVNSISPGWIEIGDYNSLREIDHKQHPSGRVGKPADILRACLFLTSPDNTFINGEDIVIDGGMTRTMHYAE